MNISDLSLIAVLVLLWAGCYPILRGCPHRRLSLPVRERNTRPTIEMQDGIQRCLDCGSYRHYTLGNEKQGPWMIDRRLRMAETKQNFSEIPLSQLEVR